MTTDLLYLGGATIAALVVGTLLVRGSGPAQVAQGSPTPSATPSVTSPSPQPVREPDPCPACGMAVRSPRDQDFIDRSKQQKKT